MSVDRGRDDVLTSLDVHRNDDGNSDDAVSVGAGTSSLSEGVSVLLCLSSVAC